MPVLFNEQELPLLCLTDFMKIYLKTEHTEATDLVIFSIFPDIVYLISDLIMQYHNIYYTEM